MRYKVFGIGEIRGECLYDEYEDALIQDNQVVFDFKREFKNYLMYTKFLINTKTEKSWFSFQFLPEDRFLSRKFAIITAYNPKNMIFNEFENFLRNVSLEKKLKKYEYYLSIGTLFYYFEKSFIIYDIGKEEALNLGKIFKQHSIVYNDKNSIMITEVDTKKDLIKYDYKGHKWIMKIEN